MHLAATEPDRSSKSWWITKQSQKERELCTVLVIADIRRLWRPLVAHSMTSCVTCSYCYNFFKCFTFFFLILFYLILLVYICCCNISIIYVSQYLIHYSIFPYFFFLQKANWSSITIINIIWQMPHHFLRFLLTPLHMIFLHQCVHLLFRCPLKCI